MRFRDEYVSRDDFYSLGVDEDTGGHYLSIPVSVGIADYEERYGLTPDEYRALLADAVAARALADACRRREHDERLLEPPPANRGSAV
jgi:hypothetical protein